nr:8946_t:CDS:2 [Entrophospora candida]
MSETPEPPQKTDNYFSQDCVIKISKFPEEKSTIHEAVHKQAKCLICKEVHTCRGIWGNWSCLSKNDHYFLNCPFHIDQNKVIIAIQSLLEIQVSVPNKTHLYQPEAGLRQYAIEHGMDPKNFSVITEAEKGRKILENISGLSTAWLDDLMKELEEIHTQFVQIFSWSW